MCASLRIARTSGPHGKQCETPRMQKRRHRITIYQCCYLTTTRKTSNKVEPSSATIRDRSYRTTTPENSMLQLSPVLLHYVVWLGSVTVVGTPPLIFDQRVRLGAAVSAAVQGESNPKRGGLEELTKTHQTRQERWSGSSLSGF